MDSKINAQQSNITKFLKYCEAVMNMPEPNLSKGYLEAKSKIITEFWAKLDDANDEIVQDADPENKQSTYFTNDEFDKAFTVYDKVSIRIHTKLEKFEKPPAQLGPVTLPESLILNAGERSKLKLKPIDVPIFMGDYDKWLSFRSLYDSMVHNNKKVDDLEKLHYLQSCLDGEAKDLIAQFDVAAESYPEAYKVITDRYHNEVILVDTHIMQLLSQPNLISESSVAIKGLMDTTSNNLRALKALKIDTSTWDPILLLLLVQKLDKSTRRLWEQTLKPKVRPTMTEFIEFLSTRFHALGCQQNFNFSIDTSSEVSKSKHWKNKNVGREYGFKNEQNFPPRIHQNFHNTSHGKQNKCIFGCGGSHNVTECESFKNANPTVRTDLVNGARLCKNCLRHHPGQCSSRPNCRKCGKYHHTLLHLEKSSSGQSEQSKPSRQQLSLNNHHSNMQQVENRMQSHNCKEKTERIKWDEPVLLATAIVLIRSARDNSFYPFRALLDQASEASYITENVVQFLGLKKIGVTATTSGLGGVTTGNVKHIVDFEMGSKRNTTFNIEVQAPVTRKITNPLPSSWIVDTDWDHIRDLQLADPEFNKPGKIDLLLGAPVYGFLLLPGLKKGSPTVPVAQNTEFGWVLSGGTRTSIPRNLTTFHLKLELEDQLKKFFDQEELSKERLLTKEEIECEKFFERTVQRNDEGRYVVALPFKGDPESLGSSKGQAFSRFLKLESKLGANKELKEEYTQILNEYESLEHTSVIGKFDKTSDATSYYLPHHAVFKPDSTTTKTRIVFDASAKTTNGISLNDLLMTGPTLQQDLVSILLRWRLYCIVFAADIAKMYRQVMVRSQDRKFQRFIFRESKGKAILEYEHNMVTFGVTAATYLAVKSLQHLAKQEIENYPEASEIAVRDFYMDDGMSGADTVQKTIKICKDLKELLGKAKFPLRKFISNSAEVLESLPECDRELKLPLEINIDNNIKTLGIRYDPATDSFRFKVNLKESTDPPTKRSLLSETSKLFDPLGWLAPVIIRAKIMFQELWRTGLDWKQELPKNIAEPWLSFRNELHQLEKIKIDRWMRYGSDMLTFELHGFSDASEKAYAAVIYSRITQRDGSIWVTMLTSKTRVAPIKTITLPRLELCGAVLLANLMEKVQRDLNINNKGIHAWTDSTIVLGWLRANPAKLKTFVANRVVELHNLQNVNQWHHIEGDKNPADCASRGISPAELRDHKLWWNGPDCLYETKASWEQNLDIPPVTLELKNKVLSTFVITPNDDLEKLVAKYSEFKRLVRTTAICLKFVENLRSTKAARITTLCLTFINNIRTRRQKPQLIITAEDLRKAESHIVRLHQGREFPQEIHHLANNKPINKKSKILQLNPFLDSDGCLRVGGRLKESNLSYDRKHPIIIAPGSIASLIIADTHQRALHGGLRLTMNLVRESYWIMKLRNQAKKHIVNCVKCCRQAKHSSEQIMANLPKARVTETAVFTYVGLDYAGPYKIKASNVRSPPTRIKPIVINGEVIKSIPKVPVYEGYIALFVCFATKAIHLEVVSDMTTETFLAAFDRFINRRGTPECVYSDNAKTFIGAKNLIAIDQEKSILEYSRVARHVANEGIQWQFIPPRGPHHGGIWESNIKSMKHHLKRVIGDMTLTYEEMTSVLTKIEACLNSRPMWPLNDDPNDLSVITPGHFLIGRPLRSRPMGKTTNLAIGVRERWNVVQRIQRDFWEAWSQEYLNQLQPRPKWREQKRNFKEGDIVLLKEDNIAPTKWPLARVVKVHPSSDGNVRSVAIKTHNESGKLIELDRPIVKLRLLPIEQYETNSVDGSNENDVPVNN